jgi:DNA-binding response OmpR family regulator
VWYLLAVFASFPQKYSHEDMYPHQPKLLRCLWKRSVFFAETGGDDTMNIGLLEDNPAIVELIETALDMQGYQMQSFVNGERLLFGLLASRSVQDDSALPYSLLIVDYLLPGGMNGGEVIAVLRKRYPPEILPIILISGANPTDLVEVQAQFPDVTILQKPFALKTLLAVMERARTEAKNHVSALY